MTTRPQITNKVLMVEPVCFGLNKQTSPTNSFQDEAKADVAAKEGRNLQQEALAEFNAFVDLLRNEGVDVTVWKDSTEPFTPDSIFPNNWFSTHQEGFMCLYPMCAPNRQQERRADIVEALKKQYGYDFVLDFSPMETRGMYLEGTGSMILDHQYKTVYACFSERTNLKALQRFQKHARYSTLRLFDAHDKDGKTVYHTNVMMSLGDGFAVVSFDSIVEPEARDELRESLENYDREVISISVEQMHEMCGNILHLKAGVGNDADNVIAMSTRAYNGFTKKQRKRLSRYGKIIHTPLPVIEEFGGGSARCMLAELFPLVS